jgi:hypothetical protein
MASLYGLPITRGNGCTAHHVRFVCCVAMQMIASSPDCNLATSNIAIRPGESIYMDKIRLVKTSPHVMSSAVPVHVFTHTWIQTRAFTKCM